VQLEMETAKSANSKIMSKTFLRRRNANGNKSRPQDNGKSRHPVGVCSRAVPEVPVETSTTTLPADPALTVVVGGLNTQFA
jgi:hypothetical protein